MSDVSMRALRARTGLSLSQFSARYGIPSRTISSWELGERECPSYTLELLAYRIDHEYPERSDPQ